VAIDVKVLWTLFYGSNIYKWGFAMSLKTKNNQEQCKLFFFPLTFEKLKAAE